MVRKNAKPFFFDEFGEHASAPEPVFTAADIERTRCAAHDAALKTFIAEHARAQSELLTKISAQLVTARSEFETAVIEQRKMLATTARDIVTTFCIGAAADRQVDIVLGLLNKYLAATPDRTPVRVLLPHDTTAASITDLKNMIASKNMTEFAVIETSPAIAAGDCRIEWRGGAITRDMTAITKEIEAIFESMDDGVTAHGEK